MPDFFSQCQEGFNNASFVKSGIENANLATLLVKVHTDFSPFRAELSEPGPGELVDYYFASVLHDDRQRAVFLAVLYVILFR